MSVKKIKRVIKISETAHHTPAITIYTKDGGMEAAFIIKDEQSLNSIKRFLHYASWIQSDCNVDFEIESPQF